MAAVYRWYRPRYNASIVNFGDKPDAVTPQRLLTIQTHDQDDHERGACVAVDNSAQVATDLGKQPRHLNRFTQAVGKMTLIELADVRRS